MQGEHAISIRGKGGKRSTSGSQKKKKGSSAAPKSPQRANLHHSLSRPQLLPAVTPPPLSPSLPNARLTASTVLSLNKKP